MVNQGLGKNIENQNNYIFNPKIFYNKWYDFPQILDNKKIKRNRYRKELTCRVTSLILSLSIVIGGFFGFNSSVKK